MVPQDAVKRRKVEKKDAATATMLEFFAMDFCYKNGCLGRGIARTYANVLPGLSDAYAELGLPVAELRHSRKTSHVTDVDPSPNLYISVQELCFSIIRVLIYCIHDM